MAWVPTGMPGPPADLVQSSANEEITRRKLDLIAGQPFVAYATKGWLGRFRGSARKIFFQEISTPAAATRSGRESKVSSTAAAWERTP
jgi:hypothetical protein